MKLNPDCIRNILLTIEEHTDLENLIWINSKTYLNYPLLKDYTFNEIGYHMQQCEYNDYFGKSKKFNDGGFQIYDLTPKAHEFLENIRNETNWNKVKSISKDVGSQALPIISNIATTVIQSLIQGRI